MTEPTIPAGYRLVSGPHTAAEVEEGWTICARFNGPGAWRNANASNDVLRASGAHGRRVVRILDDPERDIYRIERTP